MKAKYSLGMVEEIKVILYSYIPSATVPYVLVSEKDTVRVICVERPVQKLSLILPVGEQSDSVVIKEHELYVE